MAALETEEKAEIDRLQQELHDVRNQAKEKFKDRQSKECKEEVVTVAGKKKWSRRVK